ncbi:MAG TPA: hypothetical protein VD794_10200 [Flavisolibacter sp.]|nr:hypothetical protein [Flavisolibacter sp.]
MPIVDSKPYKSFTIPNKQSEKRKSKSLKHKLRNHPQPPANQRSIAGAAPWFLVVLCTGGPLTGGALTGLDHFVQLLVSRQKVEKNVRENNTRIKRRF